MADQLRLLRAPTKPTSLPVRPRQPISGNQDRCDPDRGPRDHLDNWRLDDWHLDDWHLDDRTRAVGKAGIEAARRALAAATEKTTAA